MNQVVTLFKSSGDSIIRVMVNCEESMNHLLSDGWVDHPSKVYKKEDAMSDEERVLRDRYTELTGKKIGGRASLDTIRKKVAEAEA